MVSRGVFFAVCAVFAVLAIAAACALAPIQDETYYWAWSQAPALTYVDHPPAVAWILAGAQRVLGTGLLGLRVPALISMVAVAVLAAAAAARSGAGSNARDAAALAVFALLSAPMFAIGYLPATPDVFQGVAAALAAYLLARAFQGATAGWCFAAAFVLVASILIKHSSALLAGGAFVGALLTPRGRALLARRSTWLGVVAGLAVLAPWLYAEATAPSGGSVAYQAHRVFDRGTARGPLAIGYWLGGVLLALGPAAGALTLILGVRELRNETRDPLRTVLFTGALTLLAACLLPVWLGGGELNWSMPALAFAAPALATALISASALRPKLAAHARTAMLASTALLAILLLHIVHPFLPIAAKKDTTRRGAGFAALTARATALAEQHHATALITRRYQFASLLRFHTQDARPIVELGTSRRSQYDAWPRPALCAGDVAIVVHQDQALPPELQLTPLAESVIFDRTTERAEYLDRWILTPVRVDRDAFGPCKAKALAVSR